MVSVIVAEGFPEDYAKSIGRISNQFFQKFNFLVGEKAELIIIIIEQINKLSKSK